MLIKEIDDNFNKDFLKDSNNKILKFNDIIITKSFLNLIESNNKNIYLTFDGSILPISYFNKSFFNSGRDTWHYMKIYDMENDSYQSINDVLGIITYKNNNNCVIPFLTIFSFLSNSIFKLTESKEINNFNEINDSIKTSLYFLKDLNFAFKLKDKKICQNLFGIKTRDLRYTYIKDSIYIKAKFESTASYKYLLKILRHNIFNYRTCKNKKLRFPSV